MRPSRALLWLALPWGGALGLGLCAQHAPSAVERWFAGGLYPGVAAALGAATGRLPFSLAEVLLLTLTALGLWRVSAAIRGGAGRAVRLARLLRRALVIAGWGYLVFLLVWGLNYRRPPLRERAGYPEGAVAAEELAALCRDLVAGCARARGAVGEDETGVARLADGARATLTRAAAGFERAARRHAFVPNATAPPKPVLLSPLMSRVGVSGIFIPFTSEANVNLDLPRIQLPFVACHELAHRAGFAAEDEADFVAYLVCSVHTDADYRYSGELMAMLRGLAALRRVDPGLSAELWEGLDPAVRRDCDAIDAYWAARRSWLSGTGEGVNHLYLRSQGEGGLSAYGEMVRLLVASRRRS